LWLAMKFQSMFQEIIVGLKKLINFIGIWS
jgi:hypothetical protein